MVKSNETSGVLNVLLRRMSEHDDFPALSATINEINRTVNSETSSLNSLTKIILEDYSLTQKLLKLVNTVSYGQFGGKISTISKAVVILGFDVVRSIATALIFIEFLHNKSQAIQLRDEVIASFFSGLIARQLTINFNMNNYEEAMICGIFHHLGSLITTFYFFEESQKINELIANGMHPNKASYEVLGISYNELGTGLARNWNFPSRLLHGMQSLPSDRVSNPANELDRLNITVNLAGELTALVSGISAENKSEAINQLIKKYKPAISTIDTKQLQGTLEETMHEMSVRASILDISPRQSPLLIRIEKYTGLAIRTDETNQVIDEEASSDSNQTATQAIEDAPVETFDAAESEAVLQAGIQDVVNTLVGEYKLNDVLHMVLEAMYLGMRFNRTLMLIRDPKTNSMGARIGFGQDIDAVMPRFSFPLKSAPDVFHLAIEKGVDIVIEDIDDESMRSKIPDWYSKIPNAKSFLLLPVMVNNIAIGCFYADMKITNALDTASKSLGLLRTLRNQAVLAIKQR